MPERKYKAGSGYRYGFNGKENDSEISTQDYGMRIYDPALGRFLSLDPLTEDYPELTPFQFASNTPIWAIDLDGAEGMISMPQTSTYEERASLGNKAVNWLGKPINREVANGLAINAGVNPNLVQTNLDGFLVSAIALAKNHSATRAMPNGGSTANWRISKQKTVNTTPQRPKASAAPTTGTTKTTAANAQTVVMTTTNSQSAATKKTILYHYTNEEGQQGILSSTSLNPSMKANNPSDARYGDGQYLSDITPGTKTPAQLSRAFLNIPYLGKKFTHYVAIDVTGLNVQKGRDGVFVIPNTEKLDLTKRIVGSGQVQSSVPSSNPQNP